MPKMYNITDPMERFYEKVQVLDSECWRWVGHINKRTGYGMFWIRTTPFVVHRFAYAIFIGNIDNEMQIDHLCRNRSCVNPDHLEAVTQRENILRGEGFASKNVQKTHCEYGHPFTALNTYSRPDRDGRACRECLKRRNNEFKSRRLSFQK